MISFFVCFITFDVVNPKCFIAISPGAETPNESIVIFVPFLPISISQQTPIPASTAIILLKSSGITLFLYDFDWDKNSSRHGIDTTLTPTPSFFNLSAASTQRCTSDPDDMSITSTGLLQSSKI